MKAFSKKMNFRIYSLSLIGLSVGQFLLLIGVSFFLEPLTGDLTRLGWYSERNFGWNQPQQVFESENFSRETSYLRYADLVVIGDSFSFGRTGYQWQDFFIAQSGLSVATFFSYAGDPRFGDLQFNNQLLSTIVHSAAFQQMPPRVVVFQKVERMLDSIGNSVGDCQANKLSAQPLSIGMRQTSIHYSMQPVFREKYAWSSGNVAYAAQFINKHIFSLRTRNTVKQMELDVSGLLSNRKSNKLLIYGMEQDKASWNADKIEQIKCTLLDMQNKVQSNRKTLFVAMIVPDKLTAYSHHLVDRTYANLSVFDALAVGQLLNLVRLDWAMQAAIDKGMIDIYLPDDTHWGYRGHQIAAASLVEYLRALSEAHGNPAMTGVTPVINEHNSTADNSTASIRIPSRKCCTNGDPSVRLRK